MSDAAMPQRRVAASGFWSVLPRRVPLLALLLVSAGFVTAWSPNLWHVFGIHDDYEMLIFKNHGLLFHEAQSLFAIARPVSALLSNIPLASAESIADFRWTRLFSVATICFLGWQMMSICIHRLRVDTLPAAVIAMGTFLVPPFIYSALNAPAWAAHLVPIMIAFFSYEMLSQSNVQAIPFMGVVGRRDYAGIVRQLRAYCTLSSVWGACLVLQLAFYDYPPNSLIIAAFPVVAVLFSRAPTSYRFLLAVRDIGFVVVNLIIYFLSAKLFYLPFVRWLTFRNSETLRHSTLNLFEVRAAATYNYKLNTDPGEMLARLRGVAKVSGDLWFMPQARFHLVVVAVVVSAILVGLIRWRRTSPALRWSAPQVAASLAVLVVAFLLSASAVLGAGAAVVSYRTVVVGIVIVSILFIYAIRTIVSSIGAAATRSPTSVAAWASAATILVGCAAVAGNFGMNYLTMKLARNEAAYANGIVRQAIDNHSKALIVVDPRPFSLPEDHPVAYDRHGRAVPPYELSCFSGPCLQNGAIFTILAQQQGVPRGSLPVYTTRGGEPVPGASCALLTDPAVPIPPGLLPSAVGTIKFLRGLGAVTCVDYSLAWLSLD